MQPPHEPPDDLPSVRLLTWLSLCALLLAALIAVAVVLPAANATAVRRLANAVHFQHEDWSGVIALLLLSLAVLVPLFQAEGIEPTDNVLVTSILQMRRDVR
mgnify:CR=1 FL=1